MKKGFTLTELLAVIVILSIIAVIATPIVLNIINESRSSLNEESINMYVKAIQQAFMKENMNTSKLLAGTYVSNEDGDILTRIDDQNIQIKIKYSGNKVICNKIQVNEDNEVYLAQCKIGNDEVEYTYGKIYTEKPDLYNETLTPVIYDGNNWKVANESNKKWYDYENQEWANAVILKDDIDKKVGDIVTVEGTNPDVLAMFVWIPRYEYKIEGTYGKGGTSTASPGEIEVNFITVNQLEASEGYRIHPAFNFGGKEISGIWVGKFEMAHATTTTSSLGCTNENCIEANNLRILPNFQSLRNNTISSFFYGIRSMSMEDNVFGIDSRITDTHMIKNSEWGAVAYLSQSKYGKYGNNDYQGANKEIYMNNSKACFTGRSGGSYGGNTPVNGTYTDQESDAQSNSFGYYTYDGYLLSYDLNTKTETRDMKKVASTTGNITGIYDMSGGAFDYVMGVFANSEGVLWTGESEEKNSGFSGKLGSDGIDHEGLSWPDAKYYDIYKASSGTTISSKTACNGGICYGHATTETSKWYGDCMYFVFKSTPWFIRGGVHNHGNSAGIFDMDLTNGNAYIGATTRVILTQST